MTTPSPLGWTLPAALLAARGWAAEPVYPVRVSENHRYFREVGGFTTPQGWEDALLILEAQAS